MSNTQVARLATATAGLNFIKAMIDYSANGPLADGIAATRQWLMREGIDEKAFMACRDLAADCAHPNKHGSQLQRGIDESDNMILLQAKKAPLQLIVSGSLGRLVGRSPDVAYMVTTVATLTKVHTQQAIVEILSSMILDQGGHETKIQAKFDIRRTLIKATIEKIVDSIFVNVSNAGHKLANLPSELSKLHQHLLDDRTFAAIVMGINRSDGDIMVRSDRFLVNLTLWLLYHFEGTIEVYVQSSLLFKDQRGEHKRRLRLSISYHCFSNAEASWDEECLRRNGKVEASVGSGISWKTFVKGQDDTKHRPVSYERHALYDLDEMLANPVRRRIHITHDQRKKILDAARQILQWFFDLPLDKEWSLPGLLFIIDPRKKTSMGQRTIGDLFAQTPQMLQKATATGNLFSEAIAWDKVDEKQYQMESDSSDEDKNPEDLPAPLPVSLETFTNWFPLLRDLLEIVQPDCVCMACRRAQGLDLCRPGCKRYDSFCRFNLHLVHGLCDAVGADHVSGQVDAQSLVQGIVGLLRGVITSKMIRWDDVFVLTASAITGKTLTTGLQELQDSATIGGGDYVATSLHAAVQYGSLVVAASWLDISGDLRQTRPFSISIHEGNVLGVADDFAIIACEAMDQQESDVISIEKVEVGCAIPSAAGQTDTSHAEVHAAVFLYGEQRYRLMTCVSTGPRLAVVDPSKVIAGHWHSEVESCQHRGAKMSPGRTAPDTLIVYDFEAAFASWWSPKGLPSLSLTTRVDTHLKMNALLALVTNAAICDAETCCLDCVLDKAKIFELNKQFLITFAKVSRLEVSRSRVVPIERP